MMISLYSLFMAFMWSSVFILALYLVRKNTRFLAAAGLVPLLVLAAGITLRCLLPVEVLRFTRVLSFEGAVAAFFSSLQAPLGDSPLRVGNLFLLAWALGFLALLGRFCVCYGRFSRKLRSYLPLEDDRIQRIACQVARELHVPAPRLVQTSKTDTPQVSGLLEPVVLLPYFAGYGEEDYYFIFLHELTHWKNRDLWVKLFTEVLCDFFWWNPLVRLLKKDLAQMLELRCDAAVLKGRSEEEAEVYQKLLVKTLAYSFKKSRDKEFTLFTVSELATEDRKAILQRMELLVNQPRQVTLRNRVIVALATVCVVLMLLASYLFVIQPAYYPSEEEIVSKTAIALTADNSWLEENPDGTYSFYFEGEPSPIILSSESGQAMIADGFLEKSSEEGDNNG